MVVSTVADVRFRPAMEIARDYRSNRTNPVAVVERCLELAEAYNNSCHAFVRLFPQQALEAARDAARRLQTAGAAAGPLCGIPIAIKDLACTREGPTAAGTTFLDQYLPARDAELVARLRSAGAIILGKTTMTEGAFSVHHPAVAAPVNPWAPGYWTGASSSGSAVAVAAGLCPLALGSDTGGSIRFPSANNHLVGLKPTFGAISTGDCFALSPRLDHMGPMARCVEDVAAMFTAMGGQLTQRSPLKRRLGIDRRQWEKTCDPMMAHALEQVAAQYEELGFELLPVDLPIELTRLAAGWLDTVAVEAAEVHAPYRERHRGDYGPAFSFLLEHARQVDPAALELLEIASTRFARRLDVILEGLDALLCPVTADPNQPPGTASGAPGAEAITRSLLYTAPFDYSGHPALTLPAGFIGPAPAGYQLIGRHGEEASVLAVAREHQEACRWQETHPPG
jgi:amidase